jgi:hypothetical protein
LVTLVLFSLSPHLPFVHGTRLIHLKSPVKGQAQAPYIYLAFSYWYALALWSDLWN